MAANRLRISSHTLMYVDGFDRGVRPMADWSMSITLSTNSAPSMRSCRPTLCGPSSASSSSSAFGFLRLAASNASMRMSFTSDDLPDPLTPVTTVKVPSGNSTVTSFRLFCLAPTTRMACPLPGRRTFGMGIDFAPVRYWPVSELGLASTSAGVPAATTSPPRMPGPRPKSTR